VLSSWCAEGVTIRRPPRPPRARDERPGPASRLSGWRPLPNTSRGESSRASVSLCRDFVVQAGCVRSVSGRLVAGATRGPRFPGRGVPVRRGNGGNRRATWKDSLPASRVAAAVDAVNDDCGEFRARSRGRPCHVQARASDSTTSSASPSSSVRGSSRYAPARTVPMVLVPSRTSATPYVKTRNYSVLSTASLPIQWRGVPSEARSDTSRHRHDPC